MSTTIYDYQRLTETCEQIKTGNITPEKLKQEYKRFTENSDIILEQIAKNYKVKELKKKVFHSSDERKPNLVKKYYDNLIATFVCGQGISYMPFQGGSYEKSRDAIVEKINEQNIEKFKAEVAESRERSRKYLQGIRKGLENPETLTEFDIFIKVKGYNNLTASQKIKYDELKSQHIKQVREAHKEQEQNRKKLSSSANIDNDKIKMELKQTIHAKKQIDLFVVVLIDRVERDVFIKLRNKAKTHSGYYSRYNRDGAIPGFQFTSKDNALAFMGKEPEIKPTASDQQPAINSQKQPSCKLRTVAERLKTKAEEKLNQDRLVNTPRRAKIAAGVEADARADLQMANTMLNLANAIESGKAEHLENITAKTQIEELDYILRRAKTETLRKLQNTDRNKYEMEKDREPNTEDILNITFPELKPSASVLRSVADTVESHNKTAASQLRSRARFVDCYKFYTHGTDGRLIKTVATILKKINSYNGGQFVSHYETLIRLKKIGIESSSELRTALREYLQYRNGKIEEDPIIKMERNLIGKKWAGYFPTPDKVIETMLDYANIKDGESILEPSAGKGNICDLIREKHPKNELKSIEIVPELREILQAKGYDIVDWDFLEHYSEYDKIIMNPPFEKLQDIDHVRHAFKCLKPGGRIVSIMSESPFFRSDIKSISFREWLDQVGKSHKLPAGSFKQGDVPTGVSTRIVIIDKE